MAPGVTTTVQREDITLGIAILAEFLASGAVDTCADIPFVSTLFTLLKAAKGEVDKAVRYQEDLEELQSICGLLTGQVIDNYHDKSSSVGISDLKKCIKELNEVAEYCGHDRKIIRFIRAISLGDRINRLRKRIDSLVPIVGLAVGVGTSNRIDALVQMMVSASKRFRCTVRLVQSTISG